MIENDGQPFFCHVAPHKNAIVAEENSNIGIITVLVSSLCVPPKMVALILLTWTIFYIKRIVSFFSQLVLWQSFVVILNLEFTCKKRRRLRFMGQPTFFKIYRRRYIGRQLVTNGFSLREPMHDVRWRKKVILTVCEVGFSVVDDLASAILSGDNSSSRYWSRKWLFSAKRLDLI